MSKTATCRCGHTAAAHQHYRPGTDCGLCDCPAFRRRLSILPRYPRAI
jgi:hypothetical protein